MTKLPIPWRKAVPYQDMFAGMLDAVLVFDDKDRLVHLNPAAEKALGTDLQAATGQPLSQLFANQKNLLELCQNTEILAEITLNLAQGLSHYEAHVTTWTDRATRSSGRMVILHDITRRLEAQNASRESQLMLKQSEEKYRYLVDNIAEIILTLDLNGVITYISPAVERNTGYTVDELIGRSFRDLIHPDDIATMEANLALALEGQVKIIEVRALNTDGDVRFIRTYIQPISQNGEETGLLALVLDFTEMHQVEAALERRASQLSILKTIGEQIAANIELANVLDSAAQLIQENFGYYHVAIFTPDREEGELIMRSSSGAFSDMYPEYHHMDFGHGIVGWSAKHKTMLLANDVRHEKRYANLFPERIQTRSELAVPILIGDMLAGVLDVQSPQINAFDDNDVRVIKTVADQIAIAMENARLYEALRRQLKERERKEKMLRIQRDLLIRLNAAKSQQEILQTAVGILAEVMGASQLTVWWVEEQYQMMLAVCRLKEFQDKQNVPVPLNQGITGWTVKSGQPTLIGDLRREGYQPGLSPESLSLLCVPLMSYGRAIGAISLESPRVNAFSRDDLRLLTSLASSLVVLIERARLFEEVEHARAELEQRAEELEIANAQLLEMDRLKSHFLANLSHELRTPLNSIIGFSEVLSDELVGSLNEEHEEFLADILNSGRHLLKLINDLLDFSKMEAGGMALEPVSFNVESLFDDLRITLTPMVEKKQQKLHFQYDKNLPPLYADQTRIKQVFLNLLSNANKFTPAQGHIITTCEKFDQSQLKFVVQDNGIGIRPEDQAMIFEEFRQVDGSMTREVPGTGLGLAISKSIIEMHGGQIWVESDLGKGAAFHVILPFESQARIPPTIG